jgi:MSHA biogenesis protein MshI
LLASSIEDQPLLNNKNNTTAIGKAIMSSLFSSAKQDKQVGLDFQPGGVAVVQVRSGKNRSGDILHSDYLPSVGQQAQIQALQKWVSEKHARKSPCVCLLADDDYDVYQIDKPEVEEAELRQALSWRIKDLINYDVGLAVIDSYPMPVSSKNNAQQVSVVSAHESVVGSYVDSIKTVGLKLTAIDIHELVSKYLLCVQQGANQTQAVLSLAQTDGSLSIFHDTDLYVSRNFKIGVSQLEQVNSEDQSIYDSLLLEIQRSMDYFESYYGLGSISSLLVYPQIPSTEKMAMYLQNFTNFDIDFIILGEDSGRKTPPGLEPNCFHAYCAAMRGVYS